MIQKEKRVLQAFFFKRYGVMYFYIFKKKKFLFLILVRRHAFFTIMFALYKAQEKLEIGGYRVRFSVYVDICGRKWLP